MKRRGRTPTTAHVISARAAVAALSCAHADVVVFDARNASLVALERVAGAIAFPDAPSPPLRGRTALVYDAGSSTLSPPYSRAANAVHALVDAHPFDARVCLVSGGLPALRETAPRLVVCAPRSAAEVDRLRAKLAALKHAPKWARAALEAIIDAAKPAAAVLPWLHVGSDHDARSLPTMLSRGYTHVVAVGAELRCNFPANFEYCLVNALDVASYRLISHFPVITLFLREIRAKAEGGEDVRVLVHCFAGMSRSVAAVAAFLVAEGFAVEDALHHIASRRVGAAPNHGFLTQLAEWQTELQGPNPPVGPSATPTLELPLSTLRNPVQSRRPSELEREILNECLQEPDSMELDSGSMSPVTPAVRGPCSSSGSLSGSNSHDEHARKWDVALAPEDPASMSDDGDVTSSRYLPMRKYAVAKRGFEGNLCGNLAKCASVLKRSCSPTMRSSSSFEHFDSEEGDTGRLQGLSEDPEER